MNKQQLDEYVLGIYSEIFALPAELQTQALQSWWKSLEENCTPENPCVECLRDGGGD